MDDELGVPPFLETKVWGWWLMKVEDVEWDMLSGLWVGWVFIELPEFRVDGRDMEVVANRDRKPTNITGGVVTSCMVSYFFTWKRDFDRGDSAMDHDGSLC